MTHINNNNRGYGGDCAFDSWFVTERRQIFFEKWVRVARQQTAEVNRRVWKPLLHCSDEETAA